MDSITNTHPQAVERPALDSGDLFGVFVRILNEAYDADPAAMHTLICQRVPCNQTLADHPTVQVASEPVAKTEYFSVGMLGVINGICEPITGKRVAVKFSEPDPTTKRSKILGFVEYSPNNVLASTQLSFARKP